MSKILYVAVYIIIFSLISIGQSVPDQKEPSEPAEAEIVTIPVTEITEQADKTYEELQKLLQDLEPSDTFSAFEEELPVILDSLKNLQSNKKFNQLAELELRVLNSFHQEWKLYQNKLDEWKSTLLTNSQEVENKVKQLKEMDVFWRLTQEGAVKEKAPRAIKIRITALLKMINESEKQTKKRLNKLLLLQNSISKSHNEINELIKKITEAENLLRGQIFVRDSPPLWEALQTEPDSVHT